MKCNGILEDDIVEEAILPQNWENHKGGIFSFRYKNNSGFCVDFLFIGVIFYYKIIVMGNMINLNIATSDDKDKLNS